MKTLYNNGLNFKIVCYKIQKTAGVPIIKFRFADTS